VLNVRPDELLSRAGTTARVDGRLARRLRALRPIPPSWRASRLRMSRADFIGIAGAWIGALAILLAVALTVRWS
jgi:hypothetical protein